MHKDSSPYVSITGTISKTPWPDGDVIRSELSFDTHLIGENSEFHVNHSIPFFFPDISLPAVLKMLNVGRHVKVEGNLFSELHLSDKGVMTPRLVIRASSIKHCDDTEQDETVEDNTRGKIDGHLYVDLGLSVKWAVCNIGADYCWKCGDYFAWGETVFKAEYRPWNSKTYGKPEFHRDISGDDSMDAARALWGDNWRLPTISEFTELCENCDKQWVTTNDGVKGVEFFSLMNGENLFLPAAGYWGDSLKELNISGSYWSSTPHLDKRYANTFEFDIKRTRITHNDRFDGYTIRAVSDWKE